MPLFLIIAVLIPLILPAAAGAAEEPKSGWTVSAEKTYTFESEMATDIAFRFLTNDMGLNKAAASGVIANFISESGIRTTALGDNGTSYGLCQWHNERWDKLNVFAEEYGKPMEDIETQLNFFKQEVINDYPDVFNTLVSIEDTETGAYKAGYTMCIDYEKPLAGETSANSRGAAGATLFTQKQKKYDYSDTVLKILYMLSIYKNSYVSPKLLVNGELILPAAKDTYLPDFSATIMSYDQDYWENVNSEKAVWPEWIQTENIDSFDVNSTEFDILAKEQ